MHCQSVPARQHAAAANTAGGYKQQKEATDGAASGTCQQYGEASQLACQQIRKQPTMTDEDVVLKPKGNPFSGFGKGAGIGLKAKKATTSAAIPDDTKAKKDSERIKYTKEFLMQFMEGCTKCPIEVQQLGMPEIVISEESERDQQRQVLQKVAEDIDDRDWRTRDAIAAAPASAAPAKPAAAAQQPAVTKDANWSASKEGRDQQAAPAPASAAPAPAKAQDAPAQPAADQAANKIVKASDVGLQAYKPGTQLSPEERAIRTIKGILNKLTPEKFDRLLQQLLSTITTADILKQTITLVFENAVEQPTYCAMYAELCVRLSTELPSFPPPAGSDKSVSFRQILLNTCQDEFEGTENAREALTKVTDPQQKEEMERNVKKRTMGNMRLISELYKQDMVKDWIMTACMEDLLSAPKGRVPPEDNIEAACEMITTAGGRLSKSDRAETRKKLDDVMRMLDKLSNERSVPNRIRFIIKDVMDLKKAGWVARRELFTAKKIEEVRAQAEAELGLISSTITAALPTLPAQQRLGPAGLAMEEVPLIPPLRSGGAGAGGDADGWGLFPPLRSQAASAGGAGGKSALLGDFQPEPAQAPVQAAAAAPAAAAAATGGAAAKGKAAGGALSEEELRRKSEGLFQEYTSTLDKAEAVTCVKELNTPSWLPKLVEVGLELALNSVREKEQAALTDLLVYLATQGELTSEHLIAGLSTYTAQLEDLSMDFPKGPQQLGAFVGAAVSAGVLGLGALPKLLEGDYGVDPKRDLTAAALKAIKAAKGGDAGLAQAVKESGISLSSFLQADPELDGPDAPSVEDWLKSQGLSGVPL